MNTNIVFAFQLISSLLRPIIYSYSINKLSQESEWTSYILFIGYIPFYSVIDVTIQSYCRSKFNSQSLSPNQKEQNKTLFTSFIIISCLVALVISIATKSRPFLIATVATIYLLNSISYIYEYKFAKNITAFSTSFFEIALTSISIYLFITLKSIWILSIIICYFPLSRFIGIIFSRYGKELTLPKSITHNSSSYVFFSVASQGIAAASAAMPAILISFISFVSDSSPEKELPKLLVAFKIMLSASSLASLLVNIVGVRIFYGTVGGRWNDFERMLIIKIKKLKHVFMISTSILIIFSALNLHIDLFFYIFFATPILAVVNILSSLSLAKAIPQLSFYYQGLALLCCMGVCSASLNIPWLPFIPLLCLLMISFSQYDKLINRLQ